MDKITVAELAKECSVESKIILAEAKRLGLYVFSSTATIDASFADTIRKKILSQKEVEESKKSTTAEKKAKKPIAHKSPKTSTPATEVPVAAAKKDEPTQEKQVKTDLKVRVRKKSVKPEETSSDTVVEDAPVPETLQSEFSDMEMQLETVPVVEIPAEENTAESKPARTHEEPAVPVAQEFAPQAEKVSRHAVLSEQKVPAEETKLKAPGGDKKTATIVVPKKKAATVLIRTTTEAVAPVPPPRVIKDLQKPITVRPSWQARPGTPGGKKFVRKQK